MRARRLLERLTGRKDHQKQGPEIEACATTEGSSTLLENPNRSSSPKPSSNEAPDKPSSIPSPPLIDVDTPITELWHIAYNKLRMVNEILILDYESKQYGDLSSALAPLGANVSLRERTNAILQHKMKEVDKDTWRLKFGSTDVQIRDIAQPILGVVSRANDYISTALSSNPYASVAWMGISLLLPLALHPSEQAASLANGLDYISSLITQSRLWEDLYVRQYKSQPSAQRSLKTSHAGYKAALEELYWHILKFQATCYCYYAHSSASRLGLDVLKWNDWDALLTEIKKKESAFSAIRESWRDKSFDDECMAAAGRHKEAIEHWRDIGTQVSELQKAIKEAQQEKNRDDFLGWLCKVDHSEIYNGARNKHEDGTCAWLVEHNEKFKTWKTSPSSVLWLHGKPGSGKSILSSSVVKHLEEEHAGDPRFAVAYFFFSFSDKDKQEVDVMLSSLIKQLYVSRPDTPQSVKKLDIMYKRKGSRPGTMDLEDALLDTTRGFSSVSLVIDALDECPEVTEERSKLLKSLHQIITKMPDNLHIFCTSRPEADISMTINALLTVQNPLRVAIDLSSDQTGIDYDIGQYIESRLASGDFRSWPPDIKAKAKDILIERADGMFQYIICQFQLLEKCRSPKAIEEALKTLPVGLRATYDRVLLNVEPIYRSRIINMLKWLVASFRPLRLDELAETWMLCPKKDLPYNVEERPFDIEERLPTSEFSFTEIDAHLHVAHSSLACHVYRDTLAGKDVNLNLKNYTAKHWPQHLEIVPHKSWPEIHVHLAARALTPGSTSLRLMIMEADRLYLFREYGLGGIDEKESTYFNVGSSLLYYMLQRPYCYTIRDGFLQLTEMILPGSPWANTYLGPRDLDEALNYAIETGSIEAVHLLLNKGARTNQKSQRQGSALQAAVGHSSQAIVELLLSHSVNANRQHDSVELILKGIKVNHLKYVKLLVDHGYDTKQCGLAWAVRRSWKACGGLVQLLLDSGTDVNSRSSTGETALYEAAYVAYYGDETFYRLLEKGADINAQGGYYGNALQRICETRVNRGANLVELVELALSKGANINAEGGYYGNALQAACHNATGDGPEGNIVRLLLDKGAKINAQGGCYGTALQAACSNRELSRSEVIEFLLEKGANPRIQGGRFGNALQAACGRGFGSVDCVRLLIDRGADVNAQGGHYGNALRAACCCLRGDVIQLLIDRGADVNAQESCIWHYDVESVKLLLRNGAHVNQQGGEYGTALQAACSNEATEIVRVLLDHGADVNVQSGKLGTALQAACDSYGRKSHHTRNHHDLVRLLIEREADVHAEGGQFGSAWHAASFIADRDSTEAVDKRPLQRLLLEHGVDINGKQGKQHPTALQAAIECNSNLGSEEEDDIILNHFCFLLENGADVNIQAGTYGFPLQSACAHKRSNRAIYLLQNCPDLDIHATGGLFGTALQAAAYSGHPDLAKILLERGADPNVSGGKYRSALNAAIFQGQWYIVEMLLDHGAVSDRQKLREPDEEWLALIEKEGIREKDGVQVWGEVVVERYRIFWERQPVNGDTA
ncbi:ankyrin repeat-containing domain protein [Xylaria arbuscula]|nr:ankyrin repeat-containing domain protein [Xylaria arbuscula]